MVRLPNGEEMPPVLTSFAATYGPERRPFVVMSAPVIWRSQPNLQDGSDLDLLVRAVFIHEMTHVLQMPVMTPLLDPLARQLPKPEELTDDVIQDTFGNDPAFRQAYELERDLLYEAAREPDAVRRRALVADAVRSITARRAQFFTGDRAFYADLEDVFLVMEGSANWAAYRLARQAGLDEAAAVAAIRRSGRRWSQDLGLAIFLVLDATSDSWREEVFGTAPPPGVPALLGLQ